MSHRVLLVGDVSASVDLLDQAAFFIPHQRVALRTGAGALLASREGTLLIVTAARLPDMSVEDLIEFVAASRDGRQGPVCVMSERADGGVNFTTIDAHGVARAWNRPIELADVRVALERAYCAHEELVGASGPFVAVGAMPEDALDTWRWFSPAAA